MGSTPTYGFPYPELTDSANVPRDNRALAEAVEAAVAALAAQVTALPKPPYAMAAGVATVSGVTANGGAAVAVTFPVGRFTQPPMTMVTGSSNGYSAGSMFTATTTGFSGKYYNPTASVPTSTSIQWIAVQMTASSGAG